MTVSKYMNVALSLGAHEQETRRKTRQERRIFRSCVEYML